MKKVIDLMPFAKHLGMEFWRGEPRRIKTALQKENSTAATPSTAAPSPLSSTPQAPWPRGHRRDRHAKYFGSTVGVNVNYLSGAIGEDVFAEAGLKRGKEIIYTDVHVPTASKLLAQGSVVYRIIERGE
jgi:acyl-coenzyme A thioesterase PaaI-like protein